MQRGWARMAFAPRIEIRSDGGSARALHGNGVPLAQRRNHA